MKSFLTLALIGIFLCLHSGVAGEAPHIAVFDPQTSYSGRFQMDVGEMNAVAQTLQKSGWKVDRLTVQQLNDDQIFNAQKIAVLVLRGEAVPRENFPNIKTFAEKGGGVVALAAKNPFGMAVARTNQGQWIYSPATPQYAWQTPELASVFGLRYTYRAALVDSGVQQTATPLLKKYLPQATNYLGALPSTWVYPVENGEIFPLMRSQRGDGRDVTPQLYIARHQGCTAVISSGEFWTKGGDGWALGKETVTAMVKIALDLKSGALPLAQSDRVEIPADLPDPEPLTARISTSEVNPDNAPVVARWGKFDGSGLDLNKQAAKQPLPRVLAGGASVTLPLQQNHQPTWLRVRAALADTQVGLKVTTGDRTVWNELFAYSVVGDGGNSPVEFQRRIFLPASEAKNLVLSNPGTHPLYFDAVQIENAPPRPVRWITSMDASSNQWTLSGPVNLPHEFTREWSGLRSTLWGQDIGAPGDPDRWKRTEERFACYNATGAPLELLIEGTPRWAASSQERYDTVVRKRAVPPVLEKYQEIVSYLLAHHLQEISRFEIWNEEDSRAYWLGTAEEYVQLWHAIVPLLRQAAPGKDVFVGGLTGFDPAFLDTLSRGGVLKEADMVACHPYSGAAAAWDILAGTVEGQLYALGANLPLYCNEMGFPVEAVDWYPKASFPYTPATQGRMTNIAVARLLAGGCSKFCVFFAGGEKDGMSYIDSQGRPYPGYIALRDYFKLSKKAGQRLDLSMVRADGTPQTGVYLAGAQHEDGSMTVIVNPAEVVITKFDEPAPDVLVPLILRIPLAKNGPWTARVDGQEVAMKIHAGHEPAWGEINFDLKKRCVLTVAP